MRNILCVLGVHKWKVSKVATDIYPHDKAERVCTRCNKQQCLEVHRLGLNPPEYVFKWINKERDE